MADDGRNENIRKPLRVIGKGFLHGAATLKIERFERFHAIKQVVAPDDSHGHDGAALRERDEENAGREARGAMRELDEGGLPTVGPVDQRGDEFSGREMSLNSQERKLIVSTHFHGLDAPALSVRGAPFAETGASLRERERHDRKSDVLHDDAA